MSFQTGLSGDLTLVHEITNESADSKEDTGPGSDIGKESSSVDA